HVSVSTRNGNGQINGSRSVFGADEPGSWPWVLEAISAPGTSRRPHPDHHFRRTAVSVLGTHSTLKSITLRSCGYAKLSISLSRQTGHTFDFPRRATDN